MPFAVAFISNAGSNSEGNWEDSLPAVEDDLLAGGSYWINNGGDNHTAEYVANDPVIAGTYYENCVYVVDGYCSGFAPPPQAYNRMPMYEFSLIPTNDWTLPMLSTAITGTHYFGDPSGAYYFGSSGEGPFSMLFNPNYFHQIPDGQSIDSLRFTFVDRDVDYACDYSGFDNISFEGSISFFYENDVKTFSGFEFEMVNRYEYRGYDRQHGWMDFCHIGLQIEFDLTGFESLSLSSFNRDNWSNTSVQIDLTNFDNLDRTGSFANTQLPFACNCNPSMGIEHQLVNQVVAGFIIKSGTIVLSILTLAVGVASTSYWDPFRSFIGGLLP